ncbi:MAG: large-conductance mechanosensitive channel protein MscL [Candidatus Parcubacteria bacterium]|jgi:large conductance mechanosensitive channel
MSMIKEFKKFAIKGNAIDLAVGVVIGAAFGKIVTSLVEDIINPLIGLIAGNIDFSDKVFRLSIPVGGVEPLVLRYGIFLTNVINFIIVAFAIFLVVHYISKLKEKEEKAPETTKISEEVKVLTEIKELLSQK